MKALVKKYPERGLWFEDVPEPLTGSNDVKIKIHKTAISGTDLHIYNWDEWSQKTIQTPRVIGHDYVGEIVEVGELDPDEIHTPAVYVQHVILGESYEKRIEKRTTRTEEAII